MAILAGVIFRNYPSCGRREQAQELPRTKASDTDCCVQLEKCIAILHFSGSPNLHGTVTETMKTAASPTPTPTPMATLVFFFIFYPLRVTLIPNRLDLCRYVIW
jgi:hypothetical protein